MTAIRDRIVEASLELVAERGLNRVTMSAIAEKAGVARQTLYNHYPDVDSIVVDALTSHHAAAVAHLAGLLTTIDHPGSQLEQLVRHHAVAAGHDHHSLRALGGLRPSLHEMVGSYHQAIRGFIEDALREGRRRGVFRADLHPIRDAAFVHAIVAATGELVSSGDDPTAVASAAIHNLRLVLGMAAPAG